MTIALHHYLWRPLLTLGFLVGICSCSTDDTVSPARVTIPDGQGEIIFEAFDTEAKTVSIDANYDWTFTVDDTHEICTVTREEGSDKLTITPKPNYDNKAYTAKITISAGKGSNMAVEQVTVSQKANADTYLTLLDDKLVGDNPILILDAKTDGTPTEYEIRIVTNNKLTAVLSQDQTKPEPSMLAATMRSVEINSWLSYDVATEETEEGTITVLTLISEFNADMENERTAFIELISGEGTDNKVIKKRIGVTQMPDTPTIVANPEGDEALEFTYSGGDKTFTVAANVPYELELFRPDISVWPVRPSWTSEGTDKLKTYTLTVPAHYSKEMRELTLDIREVDAPEGREKVATYVKIRQTRAPDATLTLDQTDVVFKNAETQKLVGFESSLAPSMKVVCTDAAGETPTWLTATVDGDAGAVKFVVTAAQTDSRTATAQLTVGVGTNAITKKITVTQMGTKPELLLDPETISLNDQGAAQTVVVHTNQSNWEVTNAAGSTDFTVTTDMTKNTITITGTPLSVGERKFTYVVKAGDIEKELVVSQGKSYAVGDPYIVNGKTVGIVYKVDADGVHGKAYSLNVHNTCDKFFCVRPEGSPKILNVDNAPMSTTDGKTNRDKIKSIANWQQHFTMHKWIDDLATEQGVDWYMPAIEELKEMLSAMSGAPFINEDGSANPWCPYLDIPQLESYPYIYKPWQDVKALVKQYTNDEQYLVFVHNNGGKEDDPSYLQDGRLITVYDDNWNILITGDDYAETWYSSTTWNYQGLIHSHVIMTNYYGNGPMGLVKNDSHNAETQYTDVDGSGSIHPICEF